MKDSKTRQSDFRKRQRELGRQRSEFWLTPEEKEFIIGLLKKMRVKP